MHRCASPDRLLIIFLTIGVFAFFAVSVKAAAKPDVNAASEAKIIYECDEYTITETPVAGEYTVDTPMYYMIDSRFYNGRAIIYSREGYGYIDKSGQIAISTRYAKAYPFRDGIARVVEIENAESGSEKITSYIDASEKIENDPVKISNYYGFYLTEFFKMEVFNPVGFFYQEIKSTDNAIFNDGLVLTESFDGAGSSANRRISKAEGGRRLYGYTDEDGNTIIPFEYEYGSTDFNENLALAIKKNTLYVLEKIPVVKLSANSPEVAGKRVPILMYHSVAEKPFTSNSILFVRPSELEAQLKYLSENNFQTITFEDLDNIGAFTKPILLTFDDGYKDSYTVLFPLLKKYDMKATVFIITDAVYSAEFLSHEEIVEMSDSGLVSIQSHTVSHPYLTNIGNEKLLRELSESKVFLEELTGKPVIALCYPTGKQNATVRAVVADYYTYAVLMGGGKFICGQNLLAMNRVYIKRGVSVASFAQLVN